MKNGMNRTALITGASSGIGLELARKILAEGWELIALNRSSFPEEDTQIKAALNSGQLRIYNADLTDFDSLKHALSLIKAGESRIDLLFNNAGGSFPELRYSKQGRELHYELHTVVPYIIYMELKGLIQRGELKSVVNTSTNAFKLLKEFDPDKLERPVAFKKLFGPYAITKLALSLWTKELGAEAFMEGIHLRSVDPGGNNTLRKGKNSGLPFYIKPLMKLFFAHPSKGASLLYDAAMYDDSIEAAGAYYTAGTAAPLHFAEHGRAVLSQVSSIYRQEYCGKLSIYE